MIAPFSSHDPPPVLFLPFLLKPPLLWPISRSATTVGSHFCIPLGMCPWKPTAETHSPAFSRNASCERLGGESRWRQRFRENRTLALAPSIPKGCCKYRPFLSFFCWEYFTARIQPDSASQTTSHPDLQYFLSGVFETASKLGVFFNVNTSQPHP